MFSIDTNSPQFNDFLLKALELNEAQVSELLALIKPVKGAPLVAEKLASFAINCKSILSHHKTTLNEQIILNRISLLARHLPRRWMEKYSNTTFHETLQTRIRAYHSEKNIADILGLPIEVTETLPQGSTTLENVSNQLETLAKIEQFYVSTYLDNSQYLCSLLLTQLPEELRHYYSDIFSTIHDGHFYLVEAIMNRALELRDNQQYQTSLSRNGHHHLQIAVQNKNAEAVKLILLSYTRVFLPRLDDYSPHIMTLNQALERDGHGLIWLASSYSSSEIFKIILRCYPEERLVNILTNENHKVFLALVKNNNIDGVNVLLNLFQTPDSLAEILSSFHHGALYHASTNKNLKLIKILLIAYRCANIDLTNVLLEQPGFLNGHDVRLTTEEIDNSNNWRILDVNFSLNENAFNYLKEKGGTFHDNYPSYLLEQLYRIDCNQQIIDFALSDTTKESFFDFFFSQTRMKKINTQLAYSVDENTNPNNSLSIVLHRIVSDFLPPEQRTKPVVHARVQMLLDSLQTQNEILYPPAKTIGLRNF